MPDEVNMNNNTDSTLDFSSSKMFRKSKTEVQLQDGEEQQDQEISPSELENRRLMQLADSPLDFEDFIRRQSRSRSRRGCPIFGARASNPDGAQQGDSTGAVRPQFLSDSATMAQPRYLQQPMRISRRYAVRRIQTQSSIPELETAAFNCMETIDRAKQNGALDHNLPEVHERVNILNRTSSTQTLSTEEIGMHELGRVEDQSPERVFGLMQEVYISRLEWSNQCLMKRIVFSVWSCLKSIVQDIWTGCKILLCCGCGGRLCTV